MGVAHVGIATPLQNGHVYARLRNSFSKSLLLGPELLRNLVRHLGALENLELEACSLAKGLDFQH